ncbi:MAG: acyl-CoA dehydrogenase family protein [Acidimicrobiales bacterium]
MTLPDLQSAAAAIEVASGVIRSATRLLAETGSVDADQVLAYDIAHAAAAMATARACLDYGAKGDNEAKLTSVFIADAIADLGGKLWGREAEWGWYNRTRCHTRLRLGLAQLALLADSAFIDGGSHLDVDFDLVQNTFRRFAEEQIKPHAEHIHRTNADIPESIIEGLAEMGVFGSPSPKSSVASQAAASLTTTAW